MEIIFLLNSFLFLLYWFLINTGRSFWDSSTCKQRKNTCLKQKEGNFRIKDRGQDDGSVPSHLSVPLLRFYAFCITSCHGEIPCSPTERLGKLIFKWINFCLFVNQPWISFFSCGGFAMQAEQLWESLHNWLGSQKCVQS